MNRWLKLLGALVGVAAGAFFVSYAYRALQGHDLSALAEPQVSLSLGLLTLLYMALIPVSALAWTLLLGGLERRVPISITAPILATSQFGKYLPGNVAHHIGRVVMIKSAGVGLGVGVLSIAYESILAILACAHVSALTFLWETPAAFADSAITDNRALLVALVTAGAIATISAAPFLATFVWRLRNRNLGPAQPPVLYPGLYPLAFSYLCFALNFVLIGLGLWIMASALGGVGAGISPVLLTGAFASSWLIGFITPGAPAGLGVREAALALWLNESLPSSSVVLLVLALRIATTLGDLLNLAWGSVLMRSRRRAEA
ncbi:hypothetical protein LDO32_07985 [Luteimonas sp. Y-2-2-4F]|nr:lysylphosphatidylglycerol synthase domain-containing protein [Luteimonas sp. Y-2-2-4F]MCD9031663.1 hypothetical protein [Luteimonas sp. Y-2-2-4F]